LLVVIQRVGYARDAVKAIPYRSLRSFLVLLIAGFLRVWSAESDDFLNPPGCQWGRLLFTNMVCSRALAVERCHEGFVVAGEVKSTAATSHMAAVLAVVTEDGALIRSNIYLGLEYPEWGRLGCGATAVMASHDTAGQPDGYVVTGYKHQQFIGIPGDSRPEWLNPSLWVMKTDLLLQPLWQMSLARGVFEYGPGLARWGTGVAQTAYGYVVTGQADALDVIDPLGHDSGSGGLGCLLYLDRDGRVLEVQEAQQAGNEWLGSGPKSIERTLDGGFILAIHDAVVRLDAGGTPVWTNTQPVWQYDVKESSSGGFVAVGRPRTPESPVALYQNAMLSAFNAHGAPLWSALFGYDDPGDIGRSLVMAPDSLMAAGETGSIGAGSKDVWVAKLDAGGSKLWDIALGGPGLDVGRAAALSQDGRTVVAGEAEVGANRWMWIVKVNPNLHVPQARFTVQPGSPVFRDQLLTFDASGSGNPGASIAACRWSFGDGTTGAGLTAQHSYPAVGTYEVVLEVLSSDGPRSWATQNVEVAGLVMQWQRFHGGDNYDVTGIVEAPDGGFVLAGGVDTSYGSLNHLWLFKVDRRGRPVWERLVDAPVDGSEYAHGLVRSTDGGYVVGGSSQAFGAPGYRDALLLKVDENGEPCWPLKVFGTVEQDEPALCLAATADGGYFLGGRGHSGRPMLIRTDASGNELWTRHYETENGRVADRVLATADGGAVLYARANGYADWFIRVDATGVPVWTNVVHSRASCNWLGHRQAPAEGFVVGGVYYKDLWLSFLSPDGIASGSHSWSGPAVYDIRDIVYGGAPTADGGYILTGQMAFRETPYGPLDYEVVLLKADPEGELLWLETFPGSADYDEEGRSVVPLTDGSYVIVGYDGNSSTPPVWMFKLGPNHAPTAVMELATNVVAVGEALLGDAADSSDRDGSVVGWEWDFGDGQTGFGVSVSHSYTNSGAYAVRLAAVDDQDAERFVTNTVYVTGVRTGSGFAISDTSITNCPGCDSATYPRDGVPLMVDWLNSSGFVIRGVATSGSSKTFRVTFPYPVPEGLKLYRLPAWTQNAYTLVDKHTIELKFWLNAGSYVLPFVLAKAAPLPTVSAFGSAGSGRLSVSFATTAGYRYAVEKNSGLAAAGWSGVRHARSPGDPATLDYLDGAGGTETVYVDLPVSGSGFYRVRMQAP